MKVSATGTHPRRRARGLVAVLATALCVLASTGATAHGYGHSGHRGGHLGVHHGGHGYRHHHGGSRIHFSWYAPLYVRPRYVYREPVVIYPEPVVIYRQPEVIVRERVPAPRLPDMPAFDYQPLVGQNEALLTDDRRECERLAWRQARPDPGAGTVRTVRTVRTVPGYYPEGPLPQAAGGAALGALGGAIAGDAGAGAAIGALTGAVSWMLGGASSQPREVVEDVVVTEYQPLPGPDPVALRNALAACMQSRGYGVR